MTALLAPIIGVLAAAGRAEGASARIEWGWAPQGMVALLALVAAAGVAAGVWRLYRRERAGAWKWVACGCRLLALILVGLLLMRPAVVRDAQRLIPGRVVLLLDRSASMSLTDEDTPAQPAGSSRNELVRSLLLRKDKELLRRLAEKNEVDLVAFAGESRRVGRIGPSPEAIDLPPWSPTGRTTDLVGAVETALRDTRRLAAVVIFTDGQQTEDGDLEAAAVKAGEKGVPLEFVGIGSPRALRDVSVARLVSSDFARKAQPLKMEAFLESSGADGEQVEVALIAGPEGGKDRKEILRKAVTLRGGSQTVELGHVPSFTGMVEYEAAVSGLEGEGRKENNRAARRVRVSEKKISVLIVAGGPSREFRFLRSLLDRSPDFETEVLLEEKLSAEGMDDVDVIFLSDPRSEDLPDEAVERLKDLVGRGSVGLVFQPGPAYGAEFLLDRRMAPLRELLPVETRQSDIQPLLGGGEFQRDPRPVRLGELRDHPVLRVDAGLREGTFWESAPALYWALPVSGVKKGAAELLRCGRPDAPLVVVQPYGGGRVLYCGSPETWRWRSRGIQFYERFWLNAFGYCAPAGRPAAGGAAVLLEKSRFEPGQPVRIQVRAPGQDAPVVSVRRDGREVESLKLRPTGRTDTGEATFYPDRYGTFAVVYEGPAGARVVQSFQVRRPDAETADTRLAQGAMKRAAELSGGHYLGPGEIDRLPTLIPKRWRTVLEPGPARPAWNRWSVLSIFVLVLGAEWLLRKRLHLM
ncbi:MAG: VWA domain-containing protein [Planctomycetes bacterium]|nr:VWA domain-containing protein [Planctomycetota bacterium]